MLVLAIIGVGLQIVGLFLAIRGVASTYREAIGRPLLPDLRKSARTWWRVKILRKREVKSVTGTASIVLGVAGEAQGVAYPPTIQPSDGLTIAELVTYVNEQVEHLRKQDESNRRYVHSHVEQEAGKLRVEITRVDKRVGHVEGGLTAVRNAILGRDGAGLREAVLGLTVTLVGTALGLFGLSW